VLYDTHIWADRSFAKLQVHFFSHPLEGTMLLKPLYLRMYVVLRILLILKREKRKGKSGSEMHRVERRRRENELSTTQ